MRTISTLISALAITFTLGACSKDMPSEAELQKVKDEACACKDDDCRKKVEKKIEGMMKDVKESDAKEFGEKRMALVTGAMMCTAGLGDVPDEATK